MYERLNMEKRKLLAAHLGAGASLRAAARALRVSAATVSREVARNGGRAAYAAAGAQARAARQRAGVGPPRAAATLCWTALGLLRLRWSPEQAVAWLRRWGLVVGAATIRRRVAADRAAGGRWFRWLRQRGKRRLSQAERAAQKLNHIKDRLSLRERPPAADARAELGHLEMDTMLDAGANHRAGAFIAVDRAARTIHLRPLPRITAAACAAAAIALFRDLPVVRSVTADNGGEFARHQVITAATGAPVFFADPGCPQQRGTCENAVALLRDLLRDLGNPPMATMSPAELQALADRINARPMKTLGWRSRHQAAADLLAAEQRI